LRAPDEALYALLPVSLRPSATRQPERVRSAKIPAGQHIFTRRRLQRLPYPPLYTNNKLTLAEGFTPPAEHLRFLDIARVSVIRTRDSL
jgi:hypothetical protein